MTGIKILPYERGQRTRETILRHVSDSVADRQKLEKIRQRAHVPEMHCASSDATLHPGMHGLTQDEGIISAHLCSSATRDKGWACSSLPSLRSFGKGASCNMPRFAPPPRSPQSPYIQLIMRASASLLCLHYDLSLLPRVSDGHLQANARGGLSVENHFTAVCLALLGALCISDSSA